MGKEGIHSKCYLITIFYCFLGTQSEAAISVGAGSTRLLFHVHDMFISLPVVQVLDVSMEGKEEVFYGPTLPFASNGIATCFLPAPCFTCPNLQTLQVPHHRIGAF